MSDYEARCSPAYTHVMASVSRAFETQTPERRSRQALHLTGPPARVTQRETLDAHKAGLGRTRDHR